MSNWKDIDDKGDRFRLLCNNQSCKLSLANLLNGMLHITTIHGDSRHSYTFTDQDMLFVVSQYLNSISKEDREELLEFFRSF